MAYTCRYSSGPLIPNSATATVWNVGINCPQKYLQESATTLVSLRFIYIIPIVCKITKFSLLLFVHLFENILLWLVNSHIPLQKKKTVRTSRINYWKAHEPVCSYSAMIFLLYSNEQHEKQLCNPSRHYGKYGKFTCEMSTPYLDTWKL